MCFAALNIHVHQVFFQTTKQVKMYQVLWADTSPSFMNSCHAVADADLQIRGKWGPGLKKKNFSALWASVWSKNKGGGQAPALFPPLSWSCQSSMCPGIIKQQLISVMQHQFPYSGPQHNGLNELPEMHFEFPFNLIRKSTMALLMGQSRCLLKSSYTGMGGLGPEQGFW